MDKLREMARIVNYANFVRSGGLVMYNYYDSAEQTGLEKEYELAIANFEIKKAVELNNKIKGEKK